MRKNPKFPKGAGLRTGGVESSQDFLQFDSPKTIFSQYLGGFLQNIFEEGGVHHFFLQRRGEGTGVPPPHVLLYSMRGVVWRAMLVGMVHDLRGV